MSLAGAVRAARRAEDRTHTDRCTITRPDPDNSGGWDPVTGETPPGVLTVYTGLPCRVRMPSAGERQATAGEHQWSLSDAILRVATGTTGIRIGDSVTVTGSPQGVGLSGTFVVVWMLAGSHVSAARFVVRRVDG